MNIGTAHGTFASRSILGDIFSDLGVFQQPVKLENNLNREKYDWKFNRNTCKSFVGNAISAGAR